MIGSYCKIFFSGYALGKYFTLYHLRNMSKKSGPWTTLIHLHAAAAWDDNNNSWNSQIINHSIQLVVSNKRAPLQGPDKTRMYRIETSQTVVIYNSIETQPGLYLLFNKVRIVATGKNKIGILWHHLVALYAVGCRILEVAETKIIKPTKSRLWSNSKSSSFVENV